MNKKDLKDVLWLSAPIRVAVALLVGFVAVLLFAKLSRCTNGIVHVALLVWFVTVLLLALAEATE